MNKKTRQPLFLTLSCKINLVISLLIFITGSVIGGYAIYQQYKQAKQALLENSYNIAHILANHSEFGFYTKNASDLKQKALLLGKRHDLISIRFFIENGQLLAAHSFTTETIAKPSNGVIPPALTDQIIEQEFPNFIQLVIPVKSTSPVLDDPLWQESTNQNSIGWIELLISKSNMQQSVYYSIQSILLFMSFCIFLALFLAFFLIRNITRPVHLLTQTTAKISEGDYSITLPEATTKDEVGQLFSSFSGMLEKIKDYRQQLLDYQSELEKKIAEKTHDLRLEKEQAVLLAEKADQANKMKSEFLSVMSHEIRTPMNGVLGMLELINDTKPTNEQQELLDIANNSSKNLLNLINDILDFSKIEAGHLILDKVEFSLKTIVTCCINSVNVLAERKGISLNTHYTSDISEILIGDPVRIQQILLNLIGNAIKFTNQGFVIIKISQESLPSKCSLHFEIEDSGIGISEKDQETLFDVFVQADSSNDRHYEGTGLGLAIAKRLVNLMQGEISVKSKLGKGSQFIVDISDIADPSNNNIVPDKQGGINLPSNVPDKQEEINLPSSVPDKQEEINSSSSSPDDQGGTNLSSQAYKILIVDDVEVNLMVTQRHILKLGIEHVDTVLSGMDALDMVKSSVYDLILMDCQMPGMDGFEATKAIQRFQQENGQIMTPIIALTANAFDNDRIECLDAGMDGFLSKPVTRKQLSETLNQWLKPKSETKA